MKRAHDGLDHDGTTVDVTAIWLRKIKVVVERGHAWYLVIDEIEDGPFSHITEARGAQNWRIDTTLQGIPAGVER